MWSLNSSRRKLSPIFSHTILGLIWLAELNIWHIWIFCRNICNICSFTSSSMLVHLQISQGLSWNSQRYMTFISKTLCKMQKGNGQESPEIFTFAILFLRIYIWPFTRFRLSILILILKLDFKYYLGKEPCFIILPYI